MHGRQPLAFSVAAALPPGGGGLGGSPHSPVGGRRGSGASLGLVAVGLVPLDHTRACCGALEWRVPTLQFLHSWRGVWACLADGALCLYEVSVWPEGGVCLLDEMKQKGRRCVAREDRRPWKREWPSGGGALPVVSGGGGGGGG